MGAQHYSGWLKIELTAARLARRLFPANVTAGSQR